VSRRRNLDYSLEAGLVIVVVSRVQA